jgi:hypothetical protein
MTKNKTHHRMCALSDSLPGAIRWRFCDYEELLKKELQLLAAPAARRQGPRRSSDQLRSR